MGHQPSQVLEHAPLEADRPIHTRTNTLFKRWEFSERIAAGDYRQTLHNQLGCRQIRSMGRRQDFGLEYDFRRVGVIGDYANWQGGADFFEVNGPVLTLEITLTNSQLWE